MKLVELTYFLVDAHGMRYVAYFNTRKGFGNNSSGDGNTPTS